MSDAGNDGGARGSGRRGGGRRDGGRPPSNGRGREGRRDGEKRGAAPGKGPARGKPAFAGQKPRKRDAEARDETRSGQDSRADKPRKPFVPRSRGTLSHGGTSAEGQEGRAERPRSYGRLKPEKVEGDRREPKGEGRRLPRDPERSGEGGRPSGKRFERRGDAAGGRPGGGRPDGDREPGRSFGGPAGRGSSTDDKRSRGPGKPFGYRSRDASRPEDLAMPGSMRIAKRLARAGIASRRDAEGMIADGRVKVNGRILDTPALDVSASDRIEIDGTPLPPIERTRLWLFHKMAGTVTTNRDPEGRPTVFDRLPSDMPRVLTVGRLDINTEGLLLLTNDGGLSRILELPSTGWLRRYRVRAHGRIDQARLDELRNGIAIDGILYGAIEAQIDREQGSNVWLTLGLREGKNREVKNVLGHLGLEVNRLIRVSFGPFQLGDLAEGAVQEIKGRTLREQLGERLIEEAGADFDAPIAKPFSNKPVEQAARPRTAASGSGEWISASDAPPSGKFRKRSGRDEALNRLDTKPRQHRGKPGSDERGEKDFSGRRERGSFEGGRQKREGRETDAHSALGAPAERRRSANVWAAPGARPTKSSASGASRPDRGDRPGGSPRGGSPRGTGKPRGEGPGRGRGPRPDRPRNGD